MTVKEKSRKTNIRKLIEASGVCRGNEDGKGVWRGEERGKKKKEIEKTFSKEA